MNKNKLFSSAMLVMLLTAMISVSANAIGRFSSSLTELIPLQVRIYDPTIENTPFPKTPIQVPEVYIEDHTLMFEESCNGCTLRIVNYEDEVEYTTKISSDTLVLPSTLDGEYEIQIIQDNWCFYGNIEL